MNNSPQKQADQKNENNQKESEETVITSTSKKKPRKKKNIFKRIKQYLKKRDSYTNKDILVICLSSIVIGFVSCVAILCLIIEGKNIFKVTYELKDFIKSYTSVTENYYGTISKDNLISSAINGMLASLGDDYTTQIDKENSSDFSETVEGKYEGIGCTIATNNDGQIIVASVFENSPAALAGLKEDDIILKVDGTDYTSKTSSELANYIKNTEKENFVLTIEREGEQKDLTVERKEVEMETVSSEIYEKENKKIGYLSISNFTSVTFDQFNNKLKKLESSNIEGLVIDVRGNSGGYLSSVNDISDILLEKGKVIFKLQTDNKTTTKKSTSKEKRTYPIAVLVNYGSASASEILASAIKESYDQGYVVGTNTYGKGTVQQTITLSNGSIVKYTTQKWLTPNDNWINETGVEPTNYIDLDDSYFNDPTPENDNQLQTALEVIATSE